MYYDGSENDKSLSLSVIVLITESQAILFGKTRHKLLILFIVTAVSYTFFVLHTIMHDSLPLTLELKTVRDKAT